MPTTPPASLESQRKSAVDEWDEDEFGNLVRKGKVKGTTKLPEGSIPEQLGIKGQAKVKSPFPEVPVTSIGDKKDKSEKKKKAE